MASKPKAQHDTFEQFIEIERDASKSTPRARWPKPSAMPCQVSLRSS
jgi:hypothetical protein